MPRKTTDKSLYEKILSNLKAHKFDYLFLAFCLFAALLLSLGPRLSSLAYGLLDPSFNYAVNAAGAQRLAFGTSFMSTYGPLGYLLINYLPFYLLNAAIWAIFYACIMGLGTYLFSQKYLPNKVSKWFIAILILYLLNVSSRGGFVEWSYLVTLVLFGLIYIKSGQRLRIIIAALLTFLAVVFSLTKFTLGFTSIISLALLIIFTLNESLKRRIFILIGVISAYVIGFLLLSHRLGITSPLDYIKTGIIISQRFSSAMAFYDKQTLTATIAVFIAIILLIAMIIQKERVKTLQYLFILPILGIVWKYSVARQDGHLLASFIVIIPVAVLYYLTLQVKKREDSTLLVAVAIACLIGVWANKTPFYDNNGFADMVSTPFNRVIKLDILKFIHLGKQKQVWAENSASQLGGAALPVAMKKEIDQGTVDVFPWETSIIAANNLKWKGRPSPFSFETYDPSLDNLNAAFYRSKNAPDYIVWHSVGSSGVYGVDYRQILWDEPNALFAMLENYNLVQSNDHFMLLKKKDNPVSAPFDKQFVTTQIGVNSGWKQVKKSEDGALTRLYITSKEDLPEKLVKTAVRGRYSFVEVRTTDNNTFKYRFVRDLGNQGFLINELPTSWNQLVTFMQDPTKASKNIKEYRIVYDN